MRPSRRLGLAAVVVLAACGTYGVTAGPDGSDAWGPPPPSASDDAAQDASGTDAGTSHVDGAAPCDGGAHLFCDDFDDPSTAFTGWTKNLDEGGVVDIASDAGAPTPPNAFVARAPISSSATISRSASLLGARGVSCAVDVLVASRGDFGSDLVDLDLDTATAYYRVEIRLDANGDEVFEYGLQADGGALPITETPLSLGTQRWHHVTIDLHVGAISSLVLRLDGTEVVSHPAYDLSAFPQPKSMAWTVGVRTFAGTPGTSAIAADDVVCDSVP